MAAPGVTSRWVTTRPKARGKRPATGRLDGVEAGQADDGAGGQGLLEGEGLGGCERPATDLDDEPIEGHAVVGELVDELPAERRAALDDEPVLVALAGERHGAVLDRRLEREVRMGSPACARLRAGRRVTVAPRSRQPVEDGRLGVGRHEDEQVAPRGAGDDGRGQGRVAAAGDGQRPRRVEPGDRLGHAQLEHDAHQVAGLVRAGDVAGLVLDPARRPAGRGRGARASAAARANGVVRKPWPSTAAIAVVELARPGPRSARRSSRPRAPRGRRGSGVR